MMNPGSIYNLFEAGTNGKQEDYIWPVAGEATVYDRVFIVCAGAGSFSEDETVSKLFCQFMAAKVLKFGEQEMSAELIDKLVIEGKDRLNSYAKVYSLDTDLATTFSMLILYDQKVFLSWYGDSRIYHLRGGEILFSTVESSHVSEVIRNTAIAYGIKTDSPPLYAETKWIEDVQDGDYFLLCSKGMVENVTEDDIKLLVSQNDQEKIDPTESFKRLTFEKTPDNYSMYLIRVNVDKQKNGVSNGVIANKKRTVGMVSPIFILAVTIVGLLIMLFYFRNTRSSVPAPINRDQTSKPADALHEDSVPSAIVMTAPRTQPVDVPHNDSVPSAIVMSVPKKPIHTVTDSVRNNIEKPPAAPQNDNAAAIQPEEKPEKTNLTPIVQKKLVAHPQNDNAAAIKPIEKPEKTNQTPIVEKKRETQLLIKFTTDESCKLKITNLDLDEVIDWELSQNDNGKIYLKPGKYSIVATSVIGGAKTKTYHFDVKPGNVNNTQNLRIQFTNL